MQIFSDKFLSSVNGSLVAVLDEISQIRVPQDYLSHRQALAQAYDKLVTGPVQKVMPVIGAASSLAEQLVHVGDFLAMQTGQGQPNFDGWAVNFPTQLQVTQYNELMTGLQNQHQQLLQAQNGVDALLP